MGFDSVSIQVTTPDPDKLINDLISGGVMLKSITVRDEIYLNAVMSIKQLKQVSAIIDKRGDKITITNHWGIYWYIKAFFKRPVLLIGLILYLFLVAYLPTRIFFISVEGNKLISATQILEAAEGCGLKFGCTRREIRSEMIKNMLLDSISDLSWAGINTKGCCAIILVKEKNMSSSHDYSEMTQGIYAAKDGLIRSITVTRGNALCKVGEGVKKGQLLISGYVDCGIKIRADGAEGEIVAETLRKETFVTPAKAQSRNEIVKEYTQYSIMAGKKLIKLQNSSGISPIRCAKIRKIKYLTLPGGFQLPIALIKETISVYGDIHISDSLGDNDSWLEEYGRQYILNTTTAGRVLRQQTAIHKSEELISFHGEYACCEMIGIRYSEEFDITYGKRNRTDR